LLPVIISIILITQYAPNIIINPIIAVVIAFFPFSIFCGSEDPAPEIREIPAKIKRNKIIMLAIANDAFRIRVTRSPIPLFWPKGEPKVLPISIAKFFII